MQRAVFRDCHYLRIRTPLSSQLISEELVLLMRHQHVLAYFQHSESVCVCLQPNREQISKEALNGTYKLIAKSLKSLSCYLRVCERHSAIAAWGLLLWPGTCFTEENLKWYSGSISGHYSEVSTSVTWKPQSTNSGAVGLQLVECLVVPCHSSLLCSTYHFA